MLQGLLDRRKHALNRWRKRRKKFANFEEPRFEESFEKIIEKIKIFIRAKICSYLMQMQCHGCRVQESPTTTDQTDTYASVLFFNATDISVAFEQHAQWARSHRPIPGVSVYCMHCREITWLENSNTPVAALIDSIRNKREWQAGMQFMGLRPDPSNSPPESLPMIPVTSLLGGAS